MIKQLDEGLVSHLAAGEVVERPSSIIRECIDNSIDAESSRIIINTIDGGLSSISIQDNGKGIDKNDLSNIAKAHSTSKISELNDIYDIHTLGFRGEALFSMASVGQLKIESLGSAVEIKNLKRSEVFKSIVDKGTKITLDGLFASIPARRAFLSSPSLEANRNKNLIEEKSLAFNNIEFIYINDDKTLLNYPVESQSERVARFLANGIYSNIKMLQRKEEDFSLSIFYNEGSFRRDKRKIKIYVNNRAITDPYLTSAVLYAFSPVTPGGVYPEVVLFINNSSELTDFNVHPQKKECRLRNAHDIHHAISYIFKSLENDTSIPFGHKIPTLELKDSYKEAPTLYKNKEVDYLSRANSESHLEEIPRTSSSFEYTGREEIKKSITLESLSSSNRTVFEEERESEEFTPFTYIGQIWNLFLLYTIKDELYILDQHAAEERVIFEKLKKKIGLQDLLFPQTIEVERQVSEALDKTKDIFIEKGIIIEKLDESKWVLKAIPNISKNNEREIIHLIETASEKEIEERLYATIACHSSIRKGDFVSREDAIALIKEVLLLDHPLCPHGRTFVTKIEKKDLEHLVGRI